MMPIWRRIGKYTYKAQRKERNERRRATIDETIYAHNARI
jgi:hypothetical protein